MTIDIFKIFKKLFHKKNKLKKILKDLSYEYYDTTNEIFFNKVSLDFESHDKTHQNVSC